MESTTISVDVKWVKAIASTDVPENGGTCVKVEGQQIAVFNFTTRGEWFATQNECPHKMQMVLARGMIGDKNGDPKVACPFHKKTFSVKTGQCHTDDDLCIKTYPVKVEKGFVYICI